MKKFFWQYLLLLLLFSAVLYAANIYFSQSGVDASADKGNGAHPFSVQVVLKARANPPDFWRIVEQGLEMGADEFNVSCEVTGPSQENDIDGQIELIRTAIAKKPDALILAACDYERTAPVCAEAVAAGIRLIMLDSDVDFAQKSCFVGTDNYELGQKLGALVEETLSPGDSFGVVGHVATSFTAIERRRGLLDSVSDSENRLAALAYCEGSEKLAQEQAVQMLTEHPDIRCMAGLNESSALGICAALEELELSGQVRMVTCDSSESQIKYMERGTIQAFVIQNPFNMGYLSMQAAVLILQGKKVDAHINTGSVVVTRETMRRTENQKLLFPFTDTTQG